jgi:hypothetical protein
VASNAEVGHACELEGAPDAEALDQRDYGVLAAANGPHRAVHQPSVVRRLLSVGPDGGELGDVCAGAVHPQHLCGGSAIFHNTIFLPDCRPLAISDTTQSAGRADGAKKREVAVRPAAGGTTQRMASSRSSSASTVPTSAHMARSIAFFFAGRFGATVTIPRSSSREISSVGSAVVGAALRLRLAAWVLPRDPRRVHGCSATAGARLQERSRALGRIGRSDPPVGDWGGLRTVRPT